MVYEYETAEQAGFTNARAAALAFYRQNSHPSRYRPDGRDSREEAEKVVLRQMQRRGLSRSARRGGASMVGVSGFFR